MSKIKNNLTYKPTEDGLF